MSDYNINNTKNDNQNLQSHTSYVDWLPNIVQTLFKEVE